MKNGGSMDTNKETNELLKKNLQATNRTTHAIRAFVRFLFIQLSFYTAAFLLWQIALLFPDENNCTVLGCSPHFIWQLLVAALIISGIILSSRAGWHELSLSEVPGAPLKPGEGEGLLSTLPVSEEIKKKINNWLKD
jgi:hypothetical protein